MAYLRWARWLLVSVGRSLTVERAALTRLVLVRIQAPQPIYIVQPHLDMPERLLAHGAAIIDRHAVTTKTNEVTKWQSAKVTQINPPSLAWK